MANQRILNIETKITDRSSGLPTTTVIEPIKKDISYTLFAKDIVRFKDTDNLVNIPLNTLSTTKYVRLEARYIQDDAAALPSPVVTGDFAPFKVRLNGVLYDFDVSGGVFEFHGVISSLQVSTAYAFAQIEVVSVIVS